jgi:signal transduction histidine kinase
MTQEMTTRRETTVFMVMSYVILVAAGFVGLRFDPPTTIALRGVVVILLAAVAVVQWRMFRRAGKSWEIHVYLGLYGVLAAALMFLQPGWTMYPVLYTVPLTWAILTLPIRQAMYWGLTYIIVAAASFAVGISLSEGLIAVFLYGVVYSFVGAFAHALVRADSARRESQSLLAELQEAHRQLQEYALHAEEMAVVQERNRLAREMHDTLGHRLTVAAVQLEGAQRLCVADPERAEDIVGTVREQVRDALAELRSTVATLRAPIEADLQLHSSLRLLTTNFQDATGLTVYQMLPDEMPRLPGPYRLAIYRTAQEALTNIQKHAQAQRVWLMLTVSSSRVSLLVGDDGQGISIRKEQSGFGLRGMRERAAQLGGELHVEPRKGGGTQISLRLPLPAAEESTDD